MPSSWNLMCAALQGSFLPSSHHDMSLWRHMARRPSHVAPHMRHVENSVPLTVCLSAAVGGMWFQQHGRGSTSA